MKHIHKILSLVLVVFLSGVLVAHAVEYVPLAPLPIGGATGGSTGYEDMGTYLAGMMKLIIALGGVIAIVMAIYGGIARIASGISPSAKADANKRIENALVGLALVLTSYLILNSINPDLVRINLNLPKLAGKSRAVSTTTAEMIYAQKMDECLTAAKIQGFAGGEGGDIGPKNCWGEDKYVRDLLYKGNVYINKLNCARKEDANCTSVWGLGQPAIDGLLKLAADCKCGVMVTGGTEEWLHKTHGPGKSIVDLSKIPAVNDYIIKKAVNMVVTNNGNQYNLPGGGTYLDETNSEKSTGAHWHVEFR